MSSEEGASWLDGGKSLLINNGVPRSKYQVSHNSRMKLSQNVPGSEGQMRQVPKLPDFTSKCEGGTSFKKLEPRDGPEERRVS